MAVSLAVVRVLMAEHGIAMTTAAYVPGIRSASTPPLPR
jgi:hypothetical protein